LYIDLKNKYKNKFDKHFLRKTMIFS